MKIKSYIFFILIIAFFSCRKEIAFDSDKIAPQLVVNSFITHDSTLQVDVAVSKTIPGVQSPQKWLDNATVILFENGAEKEVLTYVEPDIDEEILDEYYGYYDYTEQVHGTYIATETEIKKGSIYQVQVSHPDYPTAEAETMVPTPVEIISLDVTAEVQEQEYWSGLNVNFKLRFQDTPDIENYYRVYLDYTYGYKMPDWNGDNPNDSLIYIVREYSTSYLNSDDPLLNPEDDANDILFGSPSNRYSLFTDNVIDGKEYELSFSVQQYNYGGQGEEWLSEEGEFFHANVYLVSLTREAYLYMRSSYEQGWYDGDIFAEPVQAFSNIENGIGIFAGYSTFHSTYMSGEFPVDGVRYDGYNIENGGYEDYSK